MIRVSKQKKPRHKCRKCGAYKYEKFMRKVNDWHQGQWECNAEYMCEARARAKMANYGQ